MFNLFAKKAKPVWTNDSHAFDFIYRVLTENGINHEEASSEINYWFQRYDEPTVYPQDGSYVVCFWKSCGFDFPGDEAKYRIGHIGKFFTNEIGSRYNIVLREEYRDFVY